jgi:copper chaperone CopZ
MKTRHRIKAALVCLLLATTAPAAEERPAQPQEFKHRVTGLFQPDRVEDLRAIVAQLPGVKLVSVDFKSAEAIFSYDAATLGEGKPEKALEQLANRVGNASRSTFGIKPLSATPRDKLTPVEIRVFGLDCKACALVAYEAVAKLDGVEQATVSFKEGRVTAWIDGTKTNRESLVEALTKARVEVPAKP